jgi:hypothetical protein
MEDQNLAMAGWQQNLCHSNQDDVQVDSCMTACCNHVSGCQWDSTNTSSERLCSSGRRVQKMQTIVFVPPISGAPTKKTKILGLGTLLFSSADSTFGLHFSFQHLTSYIYPLSIQLPVSIILHFFIYCPEFHSSALQQVLGKILTSRGKEYANSVA